jgi:hypothetical protein
LGLFVYRRPGQLVARRQDAGKVLALRLAHRDGNRWIRDLNCDHEHCRPLPRLVPSRSVPNCLD